MKYLNNDLERIDIAREGQKNLYESINNKGQSSFCDWFVKQIKTIEKYNKLKNYINDIDKCNNITPEIRKISEKHNIACHINI